MNKLFFLAVISLIFSSCMTMHDKYVSNNSSATKGTRTKAIWFREIPTPTSDFYLEVSRDGQVLSREERNGGITTRRGNIRVAVASALINTIEKSDVISSNNSIGEEISTKTGLTVYAYIHGELAIKQTSIAELRAECKAKSNDDCMKPFVEIAKLVSKMPAEKDLPYLLYCEDVPSSELPSINKLIAIDGEIEIVETANIMTFPPMLAAVLDQGRMIPIENSEKTRELTDFINKYDLYGSRSEFILPTTRGTFRCLTKETYSDNYISKPVVKDENDFGIPSYQIPEID